MKAMIFAAGFGKRLLPLTMKIPKALVVVHNRPMLDWVIEHLMRHGINDIIVNTHHLHSEIEAYLEMNSYSIPISISHEETILGTGSGLYQTRHFWDNSDFYVCNVDILCKADLSAFFAFHGSHASLVSLGVNDRVAKSMLLVDQEGYLVGRSVAGQKQIVGRPRGKIHEAGFCGMHAISPSFFQHVIPPMSFSIIDDYMNLLQAGISIRTWSIGDAYWEDIGTPEALKRANRDFSG
ncbi:NTP transferase domain-containing protein [bacterium]|nr:NTP transferase domain-containing protein [bacterium]